LGHEKGGAMTKDSLMAMKDLEDHEIRSQLALLYRKFTDQLMQSLVSLGAP
jgi:hypothetical protein